ncbi:MAG: TolC family protein [Planctomycetaceae bacterium]|nr:TolC family protein [Planctomycetaceae bacterium]
MQSDRSLAANEGRVDRTLEEATQRRVDRQTEPSVSQSIKHEQQRTGGSIRLASNEEDDSAAVAQAVDANVPAAPEPLPVATDENPTAELVLDGPAADSTGELTLDLPTALSMIGGNHPAVAQARWRTTEAYARLERAEVLWLPSIQAGLSYHRHDGNLQNSNGAIIDANRNSLQYGLGAGAVGAGTTPRPGLVAQFHLADAMFQPEIADRVAQARCHAASAVLNRQLLNVALAYQELLRARQDQVVLEESRERLRSLYKLTADYAAAGQGLHADADRLQTEVRLVNSRLIDAAERTAIASARLTEQLSLQSRARIIPTDPLAVPLELTEPQASDSRFVATGLRNRPELAESQALVCAAISEYDRQHYAPFVPSLLLGFSGGGFGGGFGSSPGNFNDRYDLDAVMTWEVRNLGLGERAARRESQARVEQARFEQVRLLDQVAREVTEAATQVRHRQARIAVAQQAIESARRSYDRNHIRIRDGKGLPLEVLQSVRALEDAQREYLGAVIAYNQAQFQLQWAQGWPVSPQ